MGALCHRAAERGGRVLRHCRWLVCLGLIWLLPAQAAVLDRAIDALAVPNPGPEQIPVFLRIEAEAFWPRRLVLRRAERIVQELQFSPAQSRALAAGGEMLVLQLPRDGGGVVLELQLARSDDPAAPAESFRQRRLSRPDLHQAGVVNLRLRRSIWRAWATVLSARFAPAPEPRQWLAAARLQLDSGDALAAATGLRRMERAGQLDGSGQLLLGDARAALGLDASGAWRIAAARQDAGLAARAALRLAEAGLSTGRDDEARYWLGRIGTALPEAELPRLQALRISLGDRAAASLDDSLLAHGPVALAVYNRATADHASPALVQLERLGAIEMADELAWAVRDQANLALGYRYLRLREPERAHAAFARVRAQGPQSAAGRLGLGWAQITPSGGAQRAGPQAQRPELRPRGDQALAEARRASPFRTASGVAQGELAARLRRALVPWTDMIGADPLDPAVLEAMLAIPYALGHLGAHDDARERTGASIVLLQRLGQALAEAEAGWRPEGLEALAGGERAGQRWWRDDAWPADFFRERLAADPAVNPMLQTCQQLERARDGVAAMGAVESALQRELEQAADACQASLLARSRALLGRWREQVAAYLAEAHLAMARMHDAARPALTVGRVR